jgi:hypothetical protein
MNTLKLFRERLECLLAELVAAMDEFRTVALVEAHIEPLHLQCDILRWYVTGQELFGDALKLLKTMEMINR